MNKRTTWQGLDTQGKRGQIAEALVRVVPEDGDFTDIRVAVVGNVDSGKSTLVGVLTSGRLDNGRGLARRYFDFVDWGQGLNYVVALDFTDCLSLG